jgi:hypothetical protein
LDGLNADRGYQTNDIPHRVCSVSVFETDSKP